MRRLQTAAKYLRTSVHRVTIDYDEDDIDKAVMASQAEDKLREFMIKHPKKEK